MGQFKPMVKMETTEPSVELKLKDGGAVNMKSGGHVNMKHGGKAEGGHKKMADGGGALAALAGTPALIGRPAVNAPVRAPGKPSMASRRKAMMAKKPAKPMVMSADPAMPPMKKGGTLEAHADKPASKAHDGLKTGGVAKGQAGFKEGGSSKKAFAAGGTVNSGKPVAMPQGSKKPTPPVSTNRLAGTFKGGGTVSDKEADMSKGAYDNAAKHSRELEDAMNPLSMVKELYGKARNALRGEGSVSDKERSMPSSTKGQGAVSDKEASVIGKKRGGRAG